MIPINHCMEGIIMLDRRSARRKVLSIIGKTTDQTPSVAVTDVGVRLAMRIAHFAIVCKINQVH